MDRPEPDLPSPLRLRPRVVRIIGIVVAVLLGLSAAFVIWYLQTQREAVGSPGESVVPIATSVPSPTVEPTERPSASPTPAPPTPLATPAPTPRADLAVADLVFSVSPWYDIVSPFTTSLAADGRLVTTRMGSDGGTLLLEERRLTDLGITLVRDEIVGTQLFGASGDYFPVPLPGHELPGRGSSGYVVTFGTDTGDVRVQWSVIDADEPDWAEPSPERERLDPLGARLIALDEWLPAEAWADPAPRPHEPARYRLFTIAQPWGGELAELPPEASELAWPLEGTLGTFGELIQPSADYTVRCGVVSGEDAQRLSDALAASGTPLFAPLGESWWTSADRGERSTQRIIHLQLVALHPHENDCHDAFPR